MYGTTFAGGEYSNGSLYVVSIDGTLYQVLHSFGAPGDGTFPFAGVVLSPDGTTLYGTASQGGSAGSGTLFSFNLYPPPFTFLDFYNFTAVDNCGGNSDGENPMGSLAVSREYGNVLYGAASTGGLNSCSPSSSEYGPGTIFVVSFNGGSAHFSVFHSFAEGGYNFAGAYTNSDGAGPSDMVVGSFNGNEMAFGTTEAGGREGSGTLFAINPGITEFSTLFQFEFPIEIQAKLILSGVWLYGTALAGDNDGIVFKIKVDGTGFQPLYRFHNFNDNFAVGSLVLVDGVLYGTTSTDGTNTDGTVFSLSTDGANYSVLHSFSALDSSYDNSDGAYPEGSLLWSGGSFYGTTISGGVNDFGTVFKLAYQPNFGAEVVLAPGIAQIVLHFDPAPGLHHFNLQTAPTMNGNFTNIAGATSPYTYPITEPQRFFRLVLDTNTPPAAPDVATMPASSVGGNGAILNGSVVVNGANTTVWFQYGTTTNYGQITSNTLVSAANTNAVDVSNAVSGLAPGTLYHFQLLGSNSVGTDKGADVTFATAAPPTITTLAATSVTPGSAQLNGSVSPNGADTTWWFEYGLDTNYTGGITSPGVVSASNTTAVSVSDPVNGLTPGTLYHFQLVGTNSAGTNFGGDLTFTTSLPPTLSTLAATSVTTTTAVLNGSIYGNGSGVAAYFQYGPDTNYGSSTMNSQFFGSGNPVQDFSATISNLNPSTTYHFRSVGFNCCAEGIGADTSFTTAWAPVPPTPMSPGTTTDTGFFTSGLAPLFSWTGFSQASTYDLIISQSPYGLANIVFTGSVGGTSYQLPGNVLQSGTKYAWYMVSFNGIGDESAPSSSFYFQTPAPPMVQTLAPTNVAITSAELLGTVNPNGSSTTVYFEYGTNSSYGNTTTQTDIGTISQTFGVTVPLARDTQYHYRIDAVNTLGTSHGSDASFNTP